MAADAQAKRVCDALTRPDIYPDRPQQVEVRETHLSWVFLAGERVYKLKKPLVLDFVDYGTPERRRAMCEAEVRLNRRLAPDIYRGVRGVAIAHGAELTTVDDPRAVDFVVEMRRYDERDTLAARLACGELERDQVATVGVALARFHAGAPRADDSESPALAAERRFARNVHELLAVVEERGEIGRVQALERFAHAFITAHARTFQTRADRGCLREGHGDLRAEHVLVDRSGVQIVDCIEFDPALRRLDVADDLAFLVFDLVALGGERFIETLASAYRDAGGDPGDEPLIAFYAAYRALVRAKVALVRAPQLPATGGKREQERAHARDLIDLAERFAWGARRPLVIVVCGLPASGKSVLAGALSDRSQLPHLSSDVTRKRLAGLDPTQRAPADHYTPAWNARTYAELGRCAARALADDRGAIVDATFRHRTDRQAFASALAAGVSPLFIECRAPRTVLAERAGRREQDARRVSDADAAVVTGERDSWEPLDEVPGATHLTVRTDRPIAQITGDVLALLDQRLLDTG
ncbi:MAG TPA: AAA family ATPase [Solirubrobacteraceae bacterium]|nr:AAA family ATPase [Solirubrobacteraceae bacterium]